MPLEETGAGDEDPDLDCFVRGSPSFSSTKIDCRRALLPLVVDAISRFMVKVFLGFSRKL